MKINKVKESENKIMAIPEEPDDLFNLRRVIDIGDSIIADTSRVIKQEKEFSRPDKGERIKVRINLKVEKISFDNTIDRLKVSGVIISSSNENIAKGLHHSVTIKINDTIILEKAKWDKDMLRILSENKADFKYILVSMDSSEASIGELNGTNLKVNPNIYSGKSGKRYSIKEKNEVHAKVYFESIRSQLDIHKQDEVKIILFGPGETKKKFFNYIKGEKDYENVDLIIVEGIETSGEDGIFVFLRSEVIKEILTNSKITSVTRILDNLLHQISKGEKKYAIGINEIKHASSLNAIDSVVYSDKVFLDIGENEFIKLLNEIESKNVKTFATNSSTDIGLRVSALGGIIALLRYQIN
ncbi:MAG: mRNA surveillance protein pelota [Thermoproteota archaeon]|nr:mRNA surveillance protein pelota [Thermoproteota archaeon]